MKDKNKEFFSQKMNKKEAYLDFAASSRVDYDIAEKMHTCQMSLTGNPSSVHHFGQQALNLLDSARDEVALFLGTDPANIIFCGSATEANNLVLHGFVKKWTLFHNTIPEIITSAIEHESVFEVLRELKNQKKISLKVIDPQRDGVVSIKKILKAITPDTALVSLMYVNNETGVIQPVKELGVALKKINTSPDRRIYFHTDAVQAVQFLDCNVKNLGVDFLTISGQKIYGPKGIGALFVRDRLSLSPLILGGGQEYGLRSGTENVCAALGLAEAVKKISNSSFSKEVEKMRKLQEFLVREIYKIKGARINGSLENHTPNILNVMFSGVDARDLAVSLDFAGFAVSVGSACSAKSINASRILLAMGLSEKEALSSIRISFGKTTTKDELVDFLRALKQKLAILRNSKK